MIRVDYESAYDLKPVTCYRVMLAIERSPRGFSVKAALWTV